MLEKIATLHSCKVAQEWIAKDQALLEETTAPMLSQGIKSGLLKIKH